MFKARLHDWGFSKNLRKEDWLALAVLCRERRAQGKYWTVFQVHGQRKTAKDLQKYIRSLGDSEESFIGAGLQDMQTPDYVRAYTSEPDTENRSHSTLSEEPDSQNIKKSKSRRSNPRRHSFGNRVTPSSPRESCDNACADQFPDGAQVIFTTQELTTLTETAHPPAFKEDQAKHESPCEQLQKDIIALGNQFSNPGTLMSRYGTDGLESSAYIFVDLPALSFDCLEPSLSCSRCRQPMELHFASLDQVASNTAQRDLLCENGASTLHLPASTVEDGAWKWVALYFLAHTYVKRGVSHLAERALAEGADELRRLLHQRDPMILTASNHVVSILAMHDQLQNTKSVMSSALEVCNGVLEADDPIRITFQFHVAAASQTVKTSGITSTDFVRLYQRLLNEPDYGIDHPYTISTQYNLGWLLKFEGNFKQAETASRAAREASRRILGKLHMQTITALAVLAGTLSLQKKHAEAISLYKEVIHDSSKTLGSKHPYTLEAKRRLASEHKAIGDTEATLELYKDIVFGRAHMLGRRHPYTQGAKSDYEWALAELDKWADELGEASSELVELDALFERDDDFTAVDMDADTTYTVQAHSRSPSHSSVEHEAY